MQCNTYAPQQTKSVCIYIHAVVFNFYLIVWRDMIYDASFYHQTKVQYTTKNNLSRTLANNKNS